MADQGVLEIEQSLLLESAEQHDVFGMVITQHGDAGALARQQFADHRFPCRTIGFDIDVEAARRAVPVYEQRRLAQVLGHGVVEKRSGGRRCSRTSAETANDRPPPRHQATGRDSRAFATCRNPQAEPVRVRRPPRRFQERACRCRPASARRARTGRYPLAAAARPSASRKSRNAWPGSSAGTMRRHQSAISLAPAQPARSRN